MGMTTHQAQVDASRKWHNAVLDLIARHFRHVPIGDEGNDSRARFTAFAKDVAALASASPTPDPCVKLQSACDGVWAHFRVGNGYAYSLNLSLTPMGRQFAVEYAIAHAPPAPAASEPVPTLPFPSGLLAMQIMDDLDGRKGLTDTLDEDIRAEILAEHAKIIAAATTAYTAPQPPAASSDALAAARKALIELVAVEDLKIEWGRLDEKNYQGNKNPMSDAEIERWRCLLAEYNRRQPIAWDIARAAIKGEQP